MCRDQEGMEITNIDISRSLTMSCSLSLCVAFSHRLSRGTCSISLALILPHLTLQLFCLPLTVCLSYCLSLSITFLTSEFPGSALGTCQHVTSIWIASRVRRSTHTSTHCLSASLLHCFTELCGPIPSAPYFVLVHTAAH